MLRTDNFRIFLSERVFRYLAIIMKAHTIPIVRESIRDTPLKTHVAQDGCWPPVSRVSKFLFKISALKDVPTTVLGHGSTAAQDVATFRMLNVWDSNVSHQSAKALQDTARSSHVIRLICLITKCLKAYTYFSKCVLKHWCQILSIVNYIFKKLL